MITRFIGITLLGILIIGGLVAAFYSQAIERTLTSAPGENMSSRATNMVPEIPTSSLATMVPPTIPPQAAQIPQATILAQDTFQRTDQALWGAASDDQSWEGHANKLPAYAVVHCIHSCGHIAANQAQ